MIKSRVNTFRDKTDTFGKDTCTSTYHVGSYGSQQCHLEVLMSCVFGKTVTEIVGTSTGQV